MCRELGTDLDHAAAIGDSENDLEMLNAVALPIAMGNASAAVKNLCLRETLTNAQDGVAAAIDRIIAVERLNEQTASCFRKNSGKNRISML